MTQKQANDVKDLAKPVYEAIKMIAENTSRKCPKCKGVGTTMYSKCSNCSGIGYMRIGWKWEPEVGEWFFHGENEICLIYYFDNYHQDTQIYYVKKGELNRYTIFQGEYTIPILHWETILRVLRDSGYSMFVETQSHNCRATISRDGSEIVRKIGDDSQKAVMLAVIELGKEI